MKLSGKYKARFVHDGYVLKIPACITLIAEHYTVEVMDDGRLIYTPVKS